MKENFVLAYTFTTSDAIEGGFSDDPHDPGGATMHGITLAEYRIFKGDADLTVADLKNISWQDQQTIYLKYWNAVSGDVLPAGVDVSVFDMGVNAGPTTAIRQLQYVIGTTSDGIIGPLTLTATLKTYDSRPVDMVVKLWQAQVAYYKTLPTFQDFGRGWLARAEKRLSLAMSLCPHAKPGGTIA